ncbi:MAG: hypothetical protein HYV02_02070 [Deltaproteobacteria bacterium]|nr:hypothetical protein [Deltaproteobacteria bacterium]
MIPDLRIVFRGASPEVLGEIRRPRRGFRIHHFPDLAPASVDFRGIATPTPARATRSTASE